MLKADCPAPGRPDEDRHGGRGGRPAVWLVGLFFGGPSPTGVLLESLATSLRAAGYDIEVVAGRSAYSSGTGAAVGRFRGPVRRLFSGPARAAGLVGRLLSWGGFYAAVAWFAFTRKLPDVVVLTTTPPLLHLIFAARRLLARGRSRLVLWNQDTYPEILSAVGLLRGGSVAYRAVAAVGRWADRRVDVAVALDRAMADILRRHGAADVRVIPNWDAPGGATPAGDPDDMDRAVADARREYRYVLLYTGNYGWGHDLRPLLGWLRANPTQRAFFPLFLGGGAKWGELTAAAAEFGPGRMAVFPYVPSRDRVVRLIADADFGLVTLEDGCAGLMSPSKMHGYLAAGKPLVYLGPPRSNVADAIEEFGCGVRAGYDDPAAVPAALTALSAPGFDYGRMSAAAAAAAKRHTEEAAAAAFDRLLGELLATGRNGSDRRAAARLPCPTGSC